MKNIPIALIAYRIMLAPVILIAAFYDYYLLIIICFLLAIISDIFDGIIARHLKISTPFLRRADTIADRIFWFTAAACLYISCPDFFTSNIEKIAVVLFIEICSHLVSLIKFKKETSTHNLLSKLWGITVVLAFSHILIFCHSSYLFNICIFTGIAARLDAILIMLILPGWDCDIPSAWHAWQIKKGRAIKRRKLLNS